MTGQTVVLKGPTCRDLARQLVEVAPNGSVVNIRPARRSTDQNAKMWAMLSDVSRAKPEGRTHTPEMWKALFMHACGYEVLHEYWQNLPEHLAREDWAMTAEYLRHYALIRTGWAVPTTYTCGTRSEALRWAQQMPKPVDKQGNPVWHVRNVEGTTLTEIVPTSQAYRGMGKGNFQKSKDDVLGFLEGLVGARATESAA